MTSTRVVEGTVVDTVAEVLLLRPGTVLHYRVGDRFGRFEEAARPDTSYGDGRVVFFTGSPARMRLSVTHHQGRLAGLADLPLDLFRQLVAAGGVVDPSPGDDAG